MDTLSLIPATEVSPAEIDAFKAAFLANGERRINGSCGLLKFENAVDWQKYIARVSKGLEPDRLPSDIYMVRRAEDGKTIGIMDFRRELNDAEYHNGHLGASIVPDERCRGYGEALARIGFRMALEYGISPVVISCDEDNPASRRSIEKCGCVFERKVVESSGNVVIVFNYFDKQ